MVLKINPFQWNCLYITPKHILAQPPSQRLHWGCVPQNTILPFCSCAGWAPVETTVVTGLNMRWLFILIAVLTVQEEQPRRLWSGWWFIPFLLLGHVTFHPSHPESLIYYPLPSSCCLTSPLIAGYCLFFLCRFDEMELPYKDRFWQIFEIGVRVSPETEEELR